MWQAVLDFIFSSEYMFQLLAVEILCVLGFRRRKGFAVLAVLSAVACVGAYYGIMQLSDPIIARNETVGRALWGWRWFVSLALTALCLKLCFRESWWSVLFVASAAQASQHLAHRVRHFLMIVCGIEMNALNYVLWGLGVFAAVYALLYFGFFRELNKRRSQTSTIKSSSSR